MTLGIPSSAGVPESIAQHTLVAEFNCLDTVTALFEKYGKDIAAIIVEPVAGNMNCILPRPEFLSGLRALCDDYQSLLIIDEVMTGFRVALGGAQARYNIKSDLTTLGKNYWRWYAGWRIWWQRGNYALSRTAWRCLSSGYFVR